LHDVDVPVMICFGAGVVVVPDPEIGTCAGLSPPPPPLLLLPMLAMRLGSHGLAANCMTRRFAMSEA
jgi:hypothetical protein